MPDKPVQRHRPVRMHEPRRNGQSHDSTKQTEVLEKSCGAAECLFGAQERCCQADVHGDAAELEWKVPPVEVNIINLRKKWKGICSQVPFIVLKYRQGCI